MIILYHTHFNYYIVTPCCLVGTGLHLRDCEIAVIVSLFIRLISCWRTPQNSLSELQEIHNFLGYAPQTPLEACTLGGRLGCMSQTRLSHIYIYAGNCSDTDLPTRTSPGPPLNISPLQLHILKRGPEF
jgi:hypothetical protein